MKTIRNRKTGELQRVKNSIAAECVSKLSHTYSTKGAWKSFIKDKDKTRSKKKDNPQGTKDKLNRLKMLHTWKYTEDKHGNIKFLRPKISHARNEQLQAKKRNRQSKRA